jgi:acyl-coenzyme A synthetase/AMP-(fatty) acid ligase
MPLIQLGTRITVCQDPFPHSVARSIKASGATIMPAVPAILNGLARAGIDKKEVDSVRIWISAGSPLAPEDARRFQNAFGALIHNFYGSSETGGIAYDRTGKETLSGRSVGAPMNGISVRVSASGRLRVASPAVFRRGNPRRSGELGAHLLADLASLLDDGNIALLGRQTRMVKMAGKRLNLSEIERQLLMVGGINSARVVDFVTPAGRTRLAAAYAPALEMDKVRKVLKKVLPGWKIPEKWLPLPALPLTSRGKVNYRQLDAQLRQ